MEVNSPKPKTLLLAYTALLVLLALTMFAAAMPLGPFGLVVALAIASAKIMLIYWFFMNGRQDGASIRIFATSGIVFLAILGALVAADYLTR